MKKIKIAYVCSMLGSGGTEAFVLNVVKALPREKYDVSIMLALDETCNDLFKSRLREAESLGAKIYFLGSTGGGI